MKNKDDDDDDDDIVSNPSEAEDGNRVNPKGPAGESSSKTVGSYHRGSIQ